MVKLKDDFLRFIPFLNSSPANQRQLFYQALPFNAMGTQGPQQSYSDVSENELNRLKEGGLTVTVGFIHYFELRRSGPPDEGGKISKEYTTAVRLSNEQAEKLKLKYNRDHEFEMMQEGKAFRFKLEVSTWHPVKIFWHRLLMFFTREDWFKLIGECPHCRELFPKARPNQIYCSESHKAAAWQKRQR